MRPAIVENEFRVLPFNSPDKFIFNAVSIDYNAQLVSIWLG
ncbi:hypothetical protein [Reichenbachiella sp. MALMAid0571]